MISNSTQVAEVYSKIYHKSKIIQSREHLFTLCWWKYEKEEFFYAMEEIFIVENDSK